MKEKRTPPVTEPLPNGKRGYKPQQVTRIPPFRPGMWIKFKEFNSPLSGKTKRVKSTIATITSPDQKYAIWRIHVEHDEGAGGIDWHLVERALTPSEVEALQRRRRE